ncbi:MAG: Ldh family oxidoreductase [Pseudomonadota bacterium]|jgi:L-2-hydroxycarboxylate dehydrogenase (NAD+)
MTAPAARTLPAAALEDFITRSFTAVGMPEADARTTASLMVEADLLGSDAHGIFRLAQYVRRIREGGINLRPSIRVLRETAATALLDGDNAMGHLVVRRAADLAVEKARSAGVAWVGLRNGNHAGAGAVYARIPLAAGMVGIYGAVGSANHLPPWGGMEMLLSTNPLAIAIPAGDEPPVVLDMATTVASYGKIKARAQRGETMPEGWMMGYDGQPLLDPRRSNEGFLMPIGGHKGYGLALMIGLLAGSLNGAAMGRDVIDFNADYTTAANTGQCVIAVDPAAFGDPQAIRADVDRVSREMRSATRLPGVDAIHVPGEGSERRRERQLRDGVTLPGPLLEVLGRLAGELGIADIG